MTCSPCVTPVSRPSRSRRGWPNGWPPGVWSSTRTRPRSRTSTRAVDFLGFNIRRYPRQAADQTEQRRHAADPETAVHRGAGPARGQRRRGDREAQPDHHRVGRLLPDRGVQTRLQRAGRPHVEAGLQVGQVLPSEQVETLGRSPGTSASSTPPGRTSGYSGAGTAVSTCASSPGHRSSGTGWCAGNGVPGRPGPDRYWARRRRRSRPRWARPRCGSLRASTADARSAGSCCYTPTVTRKAPASGSSGSRPPARRSASTRSPPEGQARRTNAPPHRLIHTHCHRRDHRRRPTVQHFMQPASLQGLLEPVAGKAGTAGSEGAPAQQCAGATGRP